MLRIGLIGCGNVTLGGHLPAMLATEGIAIVAAADPTPERLEAVRSAAELDTGRSFADWRDLIALADVDAVLVATPQRFRPEIALAAAAKGKHLLCEKPLALSPADARRMVEARRGLIVNMAATNGDGGSPLMCHSGAAKAGVINLTQTLAVEWAPFGIRVNAVAPGAVSTEGANQRLWAAPELMARLEKKVPLGRFARAEDCVGPVLFLCSDAARFMTGAVLTVDGGTTLNRVPDLT